MIRRWALPLLVAVLAFVLSIVGGVRSQPAPGPAQILQNAGTCNSVAGSMFAFYFGAPPVHYTTTFDRSGNVGMCAFNGVTPTLFGGGVNIPSTGALTLQQIGASQCLGTSSLSVVVGNTNCLSAITAGSNIAVSGSGNVTVALASPTVTTWPVTNCGAFSATFGLQYFACPATPYPTPIPTCAGTTCSFAGYTLTVPTPVVTSANTNCTVAVLTITCTTPAPQNTLTSLEVVTAPTATSFAAAVVSEPIMLDPGILGIKVRGSWFVCDTAGTGGSAAAITWQTNTSNPDPGDGTWATVAAIPTTSAASNLKKAGQATFAAVAMPTDATGAHITWVRAFVATSPTTPLSGACRAALELIQQTQ